MKIKKKTMSSSWEDTMEYSNKIVHKELEKLMHGNKSYQRILQTLGAKQLNKNKEGTSRVSENPKLSSFTEFCIGIKNILLDEDDNRKLDAIEINQKSYKSRFTSKTSTRTSTTTTSRELIENNLVLGKQCGRYRSCNFKENLLLDEPLPQQYKFYNLLRPIFIFPIPVEFRLDAAKYYHFENSNIISVNWCIEYSEPCTPQVNLIKKQSFFSIISHEDKTGNARFRRDVILLNLYTEPHCSRQIECREKIESTLQLTTTTTTTTDSIPNNNTQVKLSYQECFKKFVITPIKRVKNVKNNTKVKSNYNLYSLASSKIERKTFLREILYKTSSLSSSSSSSSSSSGSSSSSNTGNVNSSPINLSMEQLNSVFNKQCSTALSEDIICSGGEKSAQRYHPYFVKGTFPDSVTLTRIDKKSHSNVNDFNSNNVSNLKIKPNNLHNEEQIYNLNNLSKLKTTNKVDCQKFLIESLQTEPVNLTGLTSRIPPIHNYPEMKSSEKNICKENQTNIFIKSLPTTSLTLKFPSRSVEKLTSPKCKADTRNYLETNENSASQIRSKGLPEGFIKALTPQHTVLRKLSSQTGNKIVFNYQFTPNDNDSGIVEVTFKYDVPTICLKSKLIVYVPASVLIEENRKNTNLTPNARVTAVITNDESGTCDIFVPVHLRKIICFRDIKESFCRNITFNYLSCYDPNFEKRLFTFQNIKSIKNEQIFDKNNFMMAPSNSTLMGSGMFLLTPQEYNISKFELFERLKTDIGRSYNIGNDFVSAGDLMKLPETEFLCSNVNLSHILDF